VEKLVHTEQTIGVFVVGLVEIEGSRLPRWRRDRVDSVDSEIITDHRGRRIEPGSGPGLFNEIKPLIVHLAVVIADDSQKRNSLVGSLAENIDALVDLGQRRRPAVEQVTGMDHRVGVMLDSTLNASGEPLDKVLPSDIAPILAMS